MTHFLYDIFKRDGHLSKRLQPYQPRKAQFRMARTVWESLSSSQHGLIEAGTGTGKSFGYALPAAYWAMKEEKRVVISTNTITLQNQLLQKELPLVKSILADMDPEWGETFRYELAKGRGNYICKRKLDQLISSSLMKESPYAALANQVQQQLKGMKNGDKDDVPFPIPGAFFDEIRGDADDCMGKESPFHDSCFIQNARRKLQKAQVIVANHALFFTDLVLRSQGASLLPDYDCVIMDEAHRIEDQVTKQFQYTVNLDLITNLFFRFTRGRTHWARSVEDQELKATVEAKYTQFYSRLVELFAPLGKNLATRDRTQYLLQRPIVEHYPFEDVFKETIQLIIDKKNFLELEHGENETTAGLGRYVSHLTAMDHMLRHVLLRLKSAEWATWVEFTPPKKDQLVKDDTYWAHCLTLNSAPIEIADILREELFQKKTVILTSATLTTQGNFGFVAERLGIDEYGTFEAPSPFNYDEQSLLIVPDKVPEPTHPSFDSFVMAAMKEILMQTKGRTFLLFTSYQQMNRVYQELQPWLSKSGMKGLLHESGVSREQLLKDFKNDSNTVLFGCESFWEGVDVPGHDLICVVISKLPFPVPTDPITKARTDRLESLGKSSFEEYTLPFSILRLKQGYGRLIRTKNDKGVVVILDSRLNTKRYGKKVLDSLPNSPISTHLDDIGSALKRFNIQP
ncbi:ATP-dependent DNA helicase [Ammoniphilus sp. CFH 90114]|uniref:ATP-dependent DNA helicase n=1 Tax=Ammoniphilus sp. CFH 90114 TaxID=2493665 RepID=UPI00100E1DBF|nr:helicase C-terminal domain-containing protein [Ammoniphilus sp. CFH 90114]RXT07860.1 DEAD/DEAH box helicase [Ammoniphilus sp. CFH 90114]